MTTKSSASTAHRSNNATTTPLLTFCVRPGSRQTHGTHSSCCPFGNDSIQFTLHAGGCLYLRGSSGLGKTSLAMYICGLLTDISNRNIVVEQCDWDPSLPVSQRCGVLFQQTTLLDELTVAGNLCVALQAAAAKNAKTMTTTITINSQIKQLLDTVGLDFARDAHKRPSQLSGGMARRASLALQLAQQKHVIVLDEPFTGLDPDAAMSVAKELVAPYAACGLDFDFPRTRLGGRRHGPGSNKGQCDCDTGTADYAATTRPRGRLVRVTFGQQSVVWHELSRPLLGTTGGLSRV